MLWERVVLIGFMAAGKTAVGRRLAELLEWEFVDLDAEIERRTGAPVTAIFDRHGEAEFRRVEADASRDVLRGRSVVLATGGGWAAQPGSIDALPPRTALVCLEVGVDEALRRAAADGATRPLLETEDPLGRAAQLLAEREPSYARAQFAVSTAEKDVEVIAREIRELLDA